jgi:hypothetical protein
VVGQGGWKAPARRKEELFAWWDVYERPVIRLAMALPMERRLGKPRYRNETTDEHRFTRIIKEL